jgi:hypothetical protein
MVYRKDDKTYKISGSINIKYFMKQIEENPEKTTFPVSAQTFPVKRKVLYRNWRREVINMTGKQPKRTH